LKHISNTQHNRHKAIQPLSDQSIVPRNNSAQKHKQHFKQQTVSVVSNDVDGRVLNDCDVSSFDDVVFVVADDVLVDGGVFPVPVVVVVVGVCDFDVVVVVCVVPFVVVV
jgi:hypothetical protein